MWEPHLQFESPLHFFFAPTHPCSLSFNWTFVHIPTYFLWEHFDNLNAWYAKRFLKQVLRLWSNFIVSKCRYLAKTLFLSQHTFHSPISFSLETLCDIVQNGYTQFSLFGDTLEWKERKAGLVLHHFKLYAWIFWNWNLENFCSFRMNAVHV